VSRLCAAATGCKRVIQDKGRSWAPSHRSIAIPARAASAPNSCSHRTISYDFRGKRALLICQSAAPTARGPAAANALRSQGVPLTPPDDDLSLRTKLGLGSLFDARLAPASGAGMHDWLCGPEVGWPHMGTIRGEVNRFLPAGLAPTPQWPVWRTASACIAYQPGPLRCRQPYGLWERDVQF
jgi:hypothetical protein